MARRLMAKIDTYEKDGETKGKYVEIGVILSNDNGEYALINPEVNLAGVLMKQRVNLPGGKGKGDMVMCGIFDNTRQQQQQQQAPAQQQQQSAPSNNFAGFDDEIPPF